MHNDKPKSLFLMASLASLFLGAYAQRVSKPNIIYLMCDDMGYGASASYGDEGNYPGTAYAESSLLGHAAFV